MGKRAKQQAKSKQANRKPAPPQRSAARAPAPARGRAAHGAATGAATGSAAKRGKPVARAMTLVQPSMAQRSSLSQASRDDRFAIALMLLPVLVMAFAIAGGKLIKPRLDALALPESLTIRWPAALVRAPVGVTPPVVRPPVEIAYPTAAPVIAPVVVALERSVVAAPALPAIRREVSLAPAVRHVSLSPALPAPLLASRAIDYPAAAPGRLAPEPLAARAPSYAGEAAVVPDVLAVARLVIAATPTSLAPPVFLAPPVVTVALAYPQLPEPTLPMLPPVVPEPRWPEPRWPVPPLSPDVVIPLPPHLPIMPDTGPVITAEPEVAGGVCRPARMAELGGSRRPQSAAPRSTLDGTAFGRALAEAAEAQGGDLVIYTAEYKRIAYPRGDIPAMHGSCSDVVIRAYRSLGIDLQEHVQRARVGSGDANIDHRRTETLRRLFERLGASRSVSGFPEDYKPGDIVTYYRPHSRVSRAHIAIVSTQLAPTGRPMIVHNRGWGAQLEDALFADRITGHYRLSGAMVPPEADVTLIAGRIKPEQSISGAARRVTANSSARMRRTDLSPRRLSAVTRKITN